MKADVLNVKGEKVKTIDLPGQFDEEIRPDIIKRAVLVMQANKRQPYGANPRAGKRASANLSRRRRKYRGSYGHGISRVPRKIMTRRGTSLFWVGAVAPGMVGGRRAHPPKAEKIWLQKINIKERRLAIRSALAATCIKELVEKRGHLFKNVPIVVESGFENLKKTKEVITALTSLDLKKELERASVKKIRSGKGKSRGRKYKARKGPLIVVSQKCELQKSAKNIPGINISIIGSINAELLAPGSEPGRLTIFTDKAIEKLAKEKLFTGAKVEEKEKKTTKEVKK
ncbi:MAG: 50S ribosomal protein L4 [Nanoarchaeota archaeon]|nr:50S ribosomal protein L4 [Nanoarchaeota archaeon]